MILLISVSAVVLLVALYMWYQHKLSAAMMFYIAFVLGACIVVFSISHAAQEHSDELNHKTLIAACHRTNKQAVATNHFFNKIRSYVVLGAERARGRAKLEHGALKKRDIQAAEVNEDLASSMKNVRVVDCEKEIKRIENNG